MRIGRVTACRAAFVLLVQFSLAAVFLYSAFAKALGLAPLIQLLASWAGAIHPGPMSAAALFAAAATVLFAELGLACWLVSGMTRRASLAGASVLLLAFTLWLMHAMAIGVTFDDCACGVPGLLSDDAWTGAVVRNACLLALAITAMFIAPPAPGRHAPTVRGAAQSLAVAREHERNMR